MFKIGKFNTYLNTNLNVTTHGFRSKYNDVPTFTDTGYIYTSGTTRIKGNIAFEPTIGLKFAYQINKNSKISASAGVGCVIFNHRHDGWDETLNIPVYYYFSGGNTSKWKRGMVEMVGLGELPTFNLSYSFNIGKK